MTAPIRSMPEMIESPPLPSEVIFTIRGSDDMVEALRIIKGILGLSNGFCDDMIGVSAGHTDKVLGPTRAKGLSPFMFDNYVALFAVMFEMKLDMDAVKRMQARWEGREQGRIHVDDSRVSKKALQRAKPLVLQALSKQGNAARNAMLPGEHRSRIARKAAHARWKKQRSREPPTAP